MARRFASGERIIHDCCQVLRQPLANRFVHWGMALSIVLLFFSGFGQLPLYKRYMVADLPGMAWTANFGTTLGLHYIAAAVFLLVGTFHVVYHGMRGDLGLLPRRGDLKESWLIIKAMVTRGEEPVSHKYLAEQRLAYAFIAGNAALIALTGMIKVWKSQPGVAIPDQALYAVTMVHNLASVLLLFGIVGHLVAFVAPQNRKLVPGIFHGKVDLEYVAHRHLLWHEELVGAAPTASDEDASGEEDRAAAAGQRSNRSNAVPAGIGGGEH